MTVMSYVAQATTGNVQKLFKELNAIAGCEAELSENNEIIVLVTSTENKADEERIQKELSNLKTLGHMALVYAGNEEELIENNL